jgi:hypothetical protein
MRIKQLYVWPGVTVVSACIVSADIFFGLRSSGPAPVVPETDRDVTGVISLHTIGHDVIAELGERDDDD